MFVSSNSEKTKEGLMEQKQSNHSLVIRRAMGRREDRCILHNKVKEFSFSVDG